ncbi:MAG: hypothetical protein KTR20_00760 [Cellvibrionaceae bacterium]|nr:hypothetical protein [Cellvibrionaceae bacterium]
MHIQNLIVTGIVSALLGFAGSYVYFKPKLDSLANQQQLSPPLLVVDRIALAARAVPVGSNPKAIKAHFRNTETVIEKFLDGGFMVLDAQSVIGAPEALFLTLDDLPENEYLSDGDSDEPE